MIFPNETQDSSSVAEHYNSLDHWYRKIWGDHLHHGLWQSGKESSDKAVVQLVEYLVEKGGIKEGDKVCDIGCGYGATSRLLSQRWNADMTGFSLSERQLAYARTKDSKTSYQLCDWLNNSLPSETYDAAFSIESSEHMVDKPKFFSEAYRVLKPGGKLIVYAWLSKENPRPWEVRHLLEPICREGRLPSMGSVSDYKQLIADAGFKDIQYEDLTNKVRKTWAICGWRMLKELKNKEFRDFLFKQRPQDRIFAITVFRILFAYQTKSMLYGIFTMTK
jgi:tocopherol O-methyltransferase